MANLWNILTINEGQEVENFSEDSDAEIEFQPKINRRKDTEFDDEFHFITTKDEYQKDIWNGISQYIKRKAKQKTDDKIKKLRVENRDQVLDHLQQQVQKENSEIYISEDELKHDTIKMKRKKIKKVTKLKKTLNEFNEPSVNKDANSDVPMSFYQMNLSRPLLKAITELKFIYPTPIQAATIPLALLGKDICGCAATGTGKTAAYMLPTLERLLYRPSGQPAVTRVLVLVPTRELGVQVFQVTQQLCQFTDIQIGLAIGGLDIKVQEGILRKNPDIVIATPGRLIDHLKSAPTFNLESVEILILDEADRMLDEFFAEQMNEIIKQCSRKRQTMLFSATMTQEVENLAAISLTKSVKLFVDNNCEVASNIHQEFIRIRKDKETDREPILAALLCRTFRESCMVFVQTKKQAHRLHILLGLLGLKVAELHGNLTQPQRLDALEKFRTKQVDILVATDVAARGLDISGVKTIVNFSMPATIEHYIHRVGRTARAGRIGVSVSLAGELDRKIVKDIIKTSKKPVKSRIIPPDIVEKYKRKLEEVNPLINQIFEEELEERILSKAENQAKKVEKILKGENEKEERPWFQTPKQRKNEKKRLKFNGIEPQSDLKKSALKDKKLRKNEHPDKNINKRLNKVALLQAKIEKKRQKKRKLNVVKDDNRSYERRDLKLKSHFLGKGRLTNKNNSK